MQQGAHRARDLARLANHAAHIVLGNFDLMLHVVARSIRDYQEFYLEHLSGQPDLGDINSMTVMTTLKEAQVPV